jgi:hypothetical protein
MWSLTSQHEGRTGGPEKFRSAVKEDFFNTIGTKRTCRCNRGMSVVEVPDLAQTRREV